MNENNGKKENYFSQLAGWKRAVPIILAAFATFITVCFVTDGTGALGVGIKSLLLGLFSYGAYSIPVLLVVHAIFFAEDSAKKRTLSRIFFSVMTVLLISTTEYAVSFWGKEHVFNPPAFYTAKSGGGFFGNLVAYGLIKFLGTVGVIILAVALFIIYIAFFFTGKNSALRRILLTVFGVIAGFLAKIEHFFKKVFGIDKEKKQPKNNVSEELLDDQFFSADGSMSEIKISELGIHNRFAKTEEDVVLQSAVFHKSAVHSEATDSANVDGASADTLFSAKSDESTVKFTAFERPRPNTEPVKKEYYGLDEPADSVFTKDFKPFDLAAAQKLASKPSSKASYRSEGLGTTETARPISVNPGRDEEAERRRAEFEKRRAELKAMHEAELRRNSIVREEAPGRYTAPATKPMRDTSKTVEFTFSRDEKPTPSEPTESCAFTKTYEKHDVSDYGANTEEVSEPIISEYTTRSSSEPERLDFSPFTAETVSEPEETIELERTILAPTPSPLERAMDERDSRYTVIDDMPLSTDSVEEVSEEIADEMTLIFGEEEDGGAVYESNSTPTENIFSFGDEDEEEEITAEPEEEEGGYEEIPPEEQNPEVVRQRELFPFLNETSTEETDSAEDIAPEEAAAAPEEAAAAHEEDDLPPFDFTEPTPAMKPVPVEEPKPKEKSAEKKKADYKNYVFPPIDFLGKDEAVTGEDVSMEIQENADKLIETLASFNVTASIKGVDRGPRITRYEVVPAKGVKVSNVMNLQDNIALELAANEIRMEAPIPGKSAIGIEIPNKISSTVRLRDLLETADFINHKSKTAVCIGRDVAGQPVFGDIATMPHLLIAGATGMGKSVCINALMISMLYKARPDEVKFIMIDPKQVEFTMYNGIPHLLVPVVSDAKQAAGVLMWAVEEMERRYGVLNQLNVRNVDAYNDKISKDRSLGEPLSRIVIVIDEFADLMLQVRDPVENLVMRIAQKARAAGIHLIIGTQRPTANVITGTIKANIPSRISCKVASNVDSRTVLDASGAEKLLNKGDMLYAFAGAIKPLRVQGAFVSDGEVEAVMEHLKKFSDGDSYDSQVMDEIERAAQKCSKKSGGSDYDDDDDGSSGEGYLNDRQFLDAVEVAVNTGKISTSLIQRKLSIGYGKAAKFIDIMEDMGIVGEQNGQKPREVKISPDEWREKLARASLD